MKTTFTSGWIARSSSATVASAENDVRDDEVDGTFPDGGGSGLALGSEHDLVASGLQDPDDEPADRSIVLHNQNPSLRHLFHLAGCSGRLSGHGQDRRPILIGPAATHRP
jgi:hypothetical protein